jgi:hypothetical protein
LKTLLPLFSFSLFSLSVLISDWSHCLSLSSCDSLRCSIVTSPWASVSILLPSLSSVSRESQHTTSRMLSLEDQRRSSKQLWCLLPLIGISNRRFCLWAHLSLSLTVPFSSRIQLMQAVWPTLYIITLACLSLSALLCGPALITTIRHRSDTAASVSPTAPSSQQSKDLDSSQSSSLDNSRSPLVV